jgi:hypothetical protein
LRERIYWGWAAIVDRFDDLAFVWRERHRRTSERLLVLRMRLAERLLDVLCGFKSTLVPAPRAATTTPFALPFEPEAAGEGAMLDAISLRIADLAESEQLLEARSTRLASLEQWLTHRQSELRAREADLDEQSARAQAEVEWRRLELELRERELRELEEALRTRLESHPPVSSEPGGVAAPVRPIRPRRRFDPDVASELRRARRERRSA